MALTLTATGAGDRWRQDPSSVCGLPKGKHAATGQVRLNRRHRKGSASEACPPRAAPRILALFAPLLGLTLAAAPGADASAGPFIKAYGWGVLDGASRFETCNSTCQARLAGGGPGELDDPFGVAIDSSGDVYVAVLTLTGPKPTGCTAGVASAARKHRRERRLWGSASGHFRTVGSDASASELGTKWLTEDTCAGTLIRVTQGAVAVDDFPHHRTFVLRAPHSFLAHPGKGRLAPP